MYSTKVAGDGAAATSESRNVGAAKGAKGKDLSSWYGQLAKAWGTALDAQADKTLALADQMKNGVNGPGQALQVTAATQQLTFLCTTASNVSNSIGQALETLGRKQ
jgi:hypothetical protein